MRPKFLAQSHTFSRNLSSNAPASLRSLYISKNRTKRQLLPAACSKNPLRFAQCPCTQTAICAGAAAVAVNHPHHTNHVNHSSNKCQPAPRKCAHTCQPLQPPRLPSCAQNFLPNLTQTLANSRPSLRSVYISEHRTKRQLLQAACGKNSHCDSPSAHARRPRSAPPPLIIPIT